MNELTALVISAIVAALYALYLMIDYGNFRIVNKDSIYVIQKKRWCVINLWSDIEEHTVLTTAIMRVHELDRKSEKYIYRR